MAPFRKEQLEKFAWSWAETCNPNQITIENVNAAYRILLMKCKVGCCRRNCKGNPYCLSNLGEHRWLECSEETGNNLNDTERKKRKAGTFVGLKNLGATCYVNSLLQLWFHNLNFRKGIYKWSPVEDPEENTNITLNTEKYMPITAVGHLQVIFALLQYGNQKYIDTSDFVNCLRIDVSIQQDAQEFSKLLLSILETSLKFQSVKEVNDMIKDNFCGEYSYITRCLNCLTESRCPSTFYELDLNIHGHKTIQDSLKEFMQIELLEGDDKYFCAVCKEKQDAQRFISLTQLPPVLNLQLKRFVFDKNLGYKKKLNTYISFPDVLNMTEFLPESNGEIEYTLSAVLIHSGRGANAGHYVAYICDSVSKLWYKFNDESVEEMDGKKFRLSCDDEYEPEGTKKAKLPRVPKGSYNSSNAYMLVYTLSKPKNDVAKFCRCETDNDFPLPDYLRNLVDKKNQDFNEIVQLVTVDNENEMNLQRTTAVEMVQLITMLPVETDEEDFDAISSQWLTSWLSQNNFDEEINNNNILCPHGKLDPTLLIDTKYINSDTADQLYDKYGGGPRLRSDYFSCIKCVTNNCYKIRVKNKTAEEAKEICSRMRNRINEEEVNYWVGKMSLRSWRRLVLESLDDIVESSTLNMSYLEDTLQGSNNRYDGIPKIDSVKALVNNYNDDSSNSSNNVNGCSLFRRVIPVINLPRYFEENDILRNEFMLEEGSIVLSAAETCKLIKCYTNTLEPNCKMSEVNEMLWDILQNHLPATFPKKLPNNINNSSNNSNSNSNNNNNNINNNINNNSINSINNGNNNVDSNNIKENGISSLVNNVEKSVTSVDSCTISNGSVSIKNEFVNKNCGLINGIITSSTGVNGIIPNDNNIKREKFGHFVSNGSNGQYVNNNSPQSINGVSLTTSDEQSDQAISSSCTEPDIKCNNSSSIITNGICSPINNKQTNKVKEENNEDNVSENEKLKFNEDIVCSHGNMCIEENNRRLVPPAVWGIFRKYFGNAKQFTTLDRPCGLCKSKATKDEIAKYLYKMDAQNQKELLSNLYLDRNRPFSSSKSDENASLFYIVNRDFINSWKKFIKEAGKKEPPDSIKNESTLLCTEHSKLLYDVSSGGIDKVQERICLVTEAEWKILTQMYKVDRTITVECNSDGRLVVDPKVCVTCMQARIEMETKAQFCYERAKLYIKILSSEEVDSPAEENYPSSKRAKIVSPEVNNAPSDSCCDSNQTTTATANSAVNASNAVSVITEIRRSSRPRRKTGLKELVVSSDMTLLDIKKKICSLINVAPMDQHLSKLDGSYLTENTSSLGGLGILPGEVLNLKVDEPCESDGVDEFIQQSLQPEAGFKGTVLLGCFKSPN